MQRLIVCVVFAVASLLASASNAALIVNMAMPITHTVTVQPIIVSNTDGTNTAEYFGNGTQQTIIQGFINTIWAQAGIQVSFLAANTWNNDFANVGTPGMNNPRPTGDLNAVVTNGDAIPGVGNTDPLVLDIYFVEIAAAFSDVGEDVANGYAFINANGITQHVGDNLVSFTGGQEVIASVVAHEIGHNLGLPHIDENFNLMQPGGSSNPGQRLNAGQIGVARGSQFAIAAVPEPGSAAVLSFAAFAVVVKRRRRLRPHSKAA